MTKGVRIASGFTQWLQVKDSFEDFQADTFALMHNHTRKDRQQQDQQQNLLQQAVCTTFGPTATFTQQLMPLQQHW